MAESVADSNKDQTIIEEARDRFKESQDGSDYNRDIAEEDISFGRLGEQWPEKVRAQRKAEGRPCLTINKIPAFVRQIVNDARQNKPSIQVHPVDNGADVDTAEVINGLIRSIERGSQADVAYDTALDHAVSAGFGFFRICIDYCHDESFDMEARIERIINPMAVHWDVTTTRYDAADWGYGFISEWLDDDEFKFKYKDAEPVSFDGDGRDYAANWVDGDKVRVAEYFLKEEQPGKLLLLSNGQTMREDDLDEEARMFNMVNGIQVVKEREVVGYKVTRRIVSGAEVLEEEPWPGSLIPICPVWGEEIMDVQDGRRWVRSMIRDARDPQRMFNYWRTASTELVALAPKAPFIGPKGFVPKGDKKWATANNRSHAFLEYAGNQMPQRQPFAGVPAGALQEALNASDDMKAIIGIYDSSLGARSNETSGRAILARQKEADVSNFHFVDNLSRAIQYAGRCLVEIIPSIYSQRSTVRILGEDMKEKVIKLAGENVEPEGEERLYDIGIGKYDVTVKAGPSFSTQREETREALIEIMRSVPEAGKYIGDIVMEHMDFQNSDKVAKRLKMLLPPEIQKMEAEEGAKEMPPEAQQMMVQMQAQLQQMQAQLQQAQQEAAEGRSEKGKLDVENRKVDIDAQKLELEREKLGYEKEDMQIRRMAEGMPPIHVDQSLQQLASILQQVVQTVTESNQAVQGQISGLAEVLTAPRVIDRDEQGKAIGMRIIQPQEQEF